MDMPTDIVVAIKEEQPKDTQFQENQENQNTNNILIFDKIIESYAQLESKIEKYKDNIRKLRADANQIKEEINLKKNISDDPTIHENENLLEEKIAKNNASINEETCSTAIEHINTIKSNISSNSQLANETLKPLEESFQLLKTQVRYTLLLEEILELFNKKNKLEEKMEEINSITSMLADSLGITE